MKVKVEPFEIVEIESGTDRRKTLRFALPHDHCNVVNEMLVPADRQENRARGLREVLTSSTDSCVEEQQNGMRYHRFDVT